MAAGGCPKGIPDRQWAREQFGGKVCKSHGFSWGPTSKQKSTGFEILFPWLTGVSYTLWWKPFNEGKGLVPLKACIMQGVQEDALGATVIDLFWVCTELESFSFPCSREKVDVIWHSYNIAVGCLFLRDSAVAGVARSCYGPRASVGHNKIQHVLSITERLSAAI